MICPLCQSKMLPFSYDIDIFNCRNHLPFRYEFTPGSFFTETFWLPNEFSITKTKNDTFIILGDKYFHLPKDFLNELSNLSPQEIKDRINIILYFK